MVFGIRAVCSDDDSVQKIIWLFKNILAYAYSNKWIGINCAIIFEIFVKSFLYWLRMCWNRIMLLCQRGFLQNANETMSCPLRGSHGVANLNSTPACVQVENSHHSDQPRKKRPFD